MKLHESCLFQAALDCLLVADPAEKVALTRETAKRWRHGGLSLDGGARPGEITDPGRPDRPELVHPSRVAKRSLTSDVGRAAFIHAIAHIEFNAINLALDAVYRFRGMPEDFYTDWLQVAEEEAGHFELLQDRLGRLGYRYGDFPAHNGLWEMARKTAADVVERMALVPRVLEARGLDVTPGMIERLDKAGDSDSVSVLRVILEDEIGHVEAGTRWFRYSCEQRGIAPFETFIGLLNAYFPGSIRGPLNTDARLLAGFDKEELEYLEQTL